MPAGSAVELSVVVPAWNEEAFLAGTLASIKATLAELDTTSELIVVDNNSTDGTARVASDAGARVVFEPINQIARARNAGAARSAGRYLLFVDADTQITSQLARGVLEYLRDDTVVGGGAVLQPDVEISKLALSGFRFWSWISKTFGYAAGSCFWCRRDAFEAVGGFPESRYAGEELVLSRTLKRWGRKHDMRFRIITDAPVVTSARKLEWYGPLDLLKQVCFALIPGALNSKRMMSTWYDDAGRRALREGEEEEESSGTAKKR